MDTDTPNELAKNGFALIGQLAGLVGTAAALAAGRVQRKAAR